MLLLFLEILFTITIGTLAILYVNQLRRYYALKPITGPLLVPIIGHTLEFSTRPEERYYDFERLAKNNGKLFQLWLGPFSQYVVLMDSEIAAKIINSSKHIDKMDLYDYLVQWLGYGLLISTGEKWRKRRKILTPAFHFTILEQSVEIFNQASNIMIEKLKRHVDGETFDVYPYVTLCGLDVICETAMGTRINAQTHSESEYVRAVRNVCNILFSRMLSTLQRFDLYFNYLSTDGKIYNKSLKILHDTTDRVIKERRKLLLDELAKGESKDTQEDSERKTPMAFLDALLKSTIDGKPLSDIDIREEVTTFMFEGHDTVSSGIAFTLHLLANHPEIQEHVFEEIREILGDDKSKVPSINQLNSMKYLEAVLKESMRLYPPVPMIGRKLTEDLHLDNVTLPAGTAIAIWIHLMHRRAEYFPEPDKFKPERFLSGREEKNYFTYIPFSAGPRNCIGQKFAMYEMKSTISKILRNFRLLPADSGDKMQLAVALVFKSLNGIPVRLTSRIYS